MTFLPLGLRVSMDRVWWIMNPDWTSWQTILSFLHHFFRTTTAMARQKVTADELNARAKVKHYQRGAYRDKDSHRD